MIKLIKENYNRALILSGFMVVVMGLVLTQWAHLGPTFTIILSFELGMIVILILVIFKRRNELFAKKENGEDITITRIKNIYDSFEKLTDELQNLNREIEKGILTSKSELESLQNQVLDMTSKEEKLRIELNILKETKPEAMQLFINELKKEDKKSLFYGFFYYALGVITPFVITYIGDHFF